jgi:hypothetical protein
LSRDQLNFAASYIFQVDQELAERGETVYLSPEKRIAIENSSIGASLSSTDFMRLGIRTPSI